MKRLLFVVNINKGKITGPSNSVTKLADALNQNKLMEAKVCSIGNYVGHLNGIQVNEFSILEVLRSDVIVLNNLFQWRTILLAVVCVFLLKTVIVLQTGAVKIYSTQKFSKVCGCVLAVDMCGLQRCTSIFECGRTCVVCSKIYNSSKHGKIPVQLIEKHQPANRSFKIGFLGRLDIEHRDWICYSKLWLF